MNLKLLVGSGKGEAASDHALEVTDPNSHFGVGWDTGCPECFTVPLTSRYLELSSSYAQL